MFKDLFIITLVVFSLKWNKVLRLFIRVKGGMHTYLEKYILNWYILSYYVGKYEITTS